jgi:hypothetical protein
MQFPGFAVRFEDEKGCTMSDVGLRMWDVGRRMFDFGFSILDVEKK